MKKNPQDSNILHIEVGSGSGRFGDKFFADCFLTDADNKFLNFIDVLCPANQLPWEADRFSKIILCNPFNYGFIDSNEGKILLEEFCRVAKDSGEIIIIGRHSNPYCTEKQILRSIQKVTLYELDFQVDYNNETQIKNSYLSHVFRKCDGEPTEPTRQFTLRVKK